MVEIFGRVEKSTLVNGTERIVFRIPAVSEMLANRRASINARVKGMSGAEITSTERIESGDIPGQSIYDVTVEASR